MPSHNFDTAMLCPMPGASTARSAATDERASLESRPKTFARFIKSCGTTATKFNQPATKQKEMRSRGTMADSPMSGASSDTLDREFIDLTLEDDGTPPEGYIDLTGTDDESSESTGLGRRGARRARRARHARNLSPCPPHRQRLIPEYTRPSDRLRLQGGMFVEIVEASDDDLATFRQRRAAKNHHVKARQGYSRLPKIEFLYIRQILQEEDDEYFVHGTPYARLKRRKLLPIFGDKIAKPNEICRILEVDEDDNRSPEIQGLITIPLNWVVRRRELRITNASIKEFASRNTDNSPLINRWIMMYRYPTAKNRENGKKVGEDIIRVPVGECTEYFGVDPSHLSREWRGQDGVKGGTYMPAGATETHRGPLQAFTMADFFCGAGGASSGAKQAGLEIQFGVDVWAEACASYEANFPRAMVFNTDIHEFNNQTANDHVRVDFAHLSPPCQVWSPAHTVASPQDAANTAALFACEEIITKVRPRIFTLEQTFGIKNFQEFFQKLKNFFIKNEYSISWRIVFLPNWGLPQRRQRLVMIGAAPGETMPAWPRDTHSEDGRHGLRKWVTVAEVLRNVRNISHHNVRGMKRFDVPKPPYSADTILPRCMTTGGGQNYHPSGTRNFTLREYACLQGFPNRHKFRGTGIKRQIGNAFPPLVVQHLYKHLQRELLKADGLAPYVVQGAIAIEDNDPNGPDDQIEELVEEISDDEDGQAPAQVNEQLPEQLNEHNAAQLNEQGPAQAPIIIPDDVEEILSDDEPDLMEIDRWGGPVNGMPTIILD